MGLSLKPTACHGDCSGCYQAETRAAGPVENWPAMLKTWAEQIEKEAALGWKSCPTLHGGEPLMMPLEVFREALRIAYKVHGSTAIQTSLVGLTSEKLALLVRYNAAVGISLDGLTVEDNAGRLGNLPEADRQGRMDRILHNLGMVCEVGLKSSVIIMLRPSNWYKIDEIIKSFSSRFGITSFRVNPVTAPGHDLKSPEDCAGLISGAQYAVALEKVFDLAISSPTFDLRPFQDFRAAMAGNPSVCAFSGCDVWSTGAERAVMPCGSLGSCQHYAPALAGLTPLRIERQSEIRRRLLAQLPQGAGGCQGCFWFFACQGGCPADGLDGDWRQRSSWCEAYKQAFSYLAGLRSPAGNPLFTAENPGKSADSQGHGDSHGDRPHGDSNDPAWRAKNPNWRAK